MRVRSGDAAHEPEPGSPLSTPLCFEDVAVLDVEAGERRGSHHVLVADGRVVTVSERAIANAPDDTVRIAGRGRTLMPGLIDAHVHPTLTSMDLAGLGRSPIMVVAQQARRILERMLRRGFTTVRDAGGGDHGLAAALERGLIDGPRYLFSGRAISQTGGHGDFRPHDHDHACACSLHAGSFSVVADGADAVRRAAREELRRGANQIKVMASGGVASPSDPVWLVGYTPEELEAAVAEARRWHTYVLAHAYTPEAISQAVRAGVRSIEHGNLVDETTAALMAERGAYLVPTLVTYTAISEMGAQLGFPARSLAKLSDVIDAGLGSLEIAARAGVPIGLGTDLLGETHDMQSRELEIRAAVQTNAEVLRSATVVNAALVRHEGQLGVILPGALADLLLVDGNPLADLSVLGGQGERIDLVVVDGVIRVGTP